MVLAFLPLTIPTVSENNHKVWTWTPKTRQYHLTISHWSWTTENLELLLFLDQKTLACYRENQLPERKGDNKLFLSSHINTMSELNTSSSSYLDPTILRNWLVTKVDRSNQCSLGICDLILMRNVPLLFFLHSSFTRNVDRHRISF